MYPGAAMCLRDISGHGARSRVTRKKVDGRGGMPQKYLQSRRALPCWEWQSSRNKKRLGFYYFMTSFLNTALIANSEPPSMSSGHTETSSHPSFPRALNSVSAFVKPLGQGYCTILYLKVFIIHYTAVTLSSKLVVMLITTTFPVALVMNSSFSSRTAFKSRATAL